MRNLLTALLFFLAGNTTAQVNYIFYNGKIFTSDKTTPWVEAIAIGGNRIMAIGKNEEILKLKTSSAQTIDLAGRVMVPGFNDAHDHVGPVYPAHRFEIAKNITDPTPWTVILDSISRIVKEVPEGTFIITTIHPDLFSNPGNNSGDLDRVAPHHPVMLSAWTGHGKILNSSALKFLGYDSNAEFLGGRVLKLKNGEPSGVLEEYAGFRVPAVLSSKLSDKIIADGLKSFYANAAAMGITSVQNMCTQLNAEQTNRIYTTEQFDCRVRLIAFPFTSHKELLLNDWANHFHPLNKKNEVSGVKLILDATPIERLAALSQPYNDKPGEFGRINFAADQLKIFIDFCIKHQQQIIIHAVGDSAIKMLIKTMRSIQPDDFWKNKRVRIEHGDLAVVNDSDLQTLSNLGIIIVQNPTHLALPQVMHQHFGPERMKTTDLMRTLIDNNIPLAIGSDGPNNPFLNIMLATINPNNPKEAISIEEAVRAYTIGSAYAEGKEKEKGSLTKGMLADLTILSQDIFSVPTQQLPATQSILTMVDGKIVQDKKLLR